MTKFAFTFTSPEVAARMIGRGAIGHGETTLLPVQVCEGPDALKQAAAKFVSKSRAVSGKMVDAGTLEPQVHAAMRALKPGDVRELLSAGRMARVVIGDHVMIAGPFASCGKADLADLRRHERAAKANARRARAVHAAVTPHVRALEANAVRALPNGTGDTLAIAQQVREQTTAARAAMFEGRLIDVTATDC